MNSRVARFESGETVTVLVGSKAGEHASVEHVVWSERDRCHYFYLTQPTRKLSRGYRADEAIAHARQLKINGIDVVTIPDSLRAGARVSALSLAVLIEQQAGVETLLHYSCRDRRLLAPDLTPTVHRVTARVVRTTDLGWGVAFVDASTELVAALRN